MFKRVVYAVALLGVMSSSSFAKENKTSKAIEAVNSFEKVWQKNLVDMIKKDSKGVKAINYCSDNIIELTKELSDEYEGITVKRTSLKYRNPKNKPLKEDILILKSFNKISKMRKTPEIRVITTKNSIKIYKPLIIKKPVCLKCHGSKRRLHPDVKAVLSEKYPNDKATNFKYRQVRGAVVATIKR